MAVGRIRPPAGLAGARPREPGAWPRPWPGTSGAWQPAPIGHSGRSFDAMLVPPDTAPGKHQASPSDWRMAGESCTSRYAP